MKVLDVEVDSQNMALEIWNISWECCALKLTALYSVLALRCTVRTDFHDY